jgi:hypothetical protein
MLTHPVTGQKLVKKERTGTMATKKASTGTDEAIRAAVFKAAGLEDIQKRLDKKRLEVAAAEKELGELEKELQNAQAATMRALGGSFKVVPGKRAAQSRPGRRSSIDTTNAKSQILGYLKDHDGAFSNAARSDLGIPKNVWLKARTELMDAKQISSKGERRGAKLFLK